MSASTPRDVRQRHTVRMESADTFLKDIRREHESIATQAGGRPCPCLDQVSDRTLLGWCTFVSSAHKAGTSSMNCLRIGVMLGMMGQTLASDCDSTGLDHVPRLSAANAHFWGFPPLCMNARALLLGWASPDSFRNLWKDCQRSVATSVFPHIQHGLRGAPSNHHVPDVLVRDILRMVDARVAFECLYDPLSDILVHSHNEQDGDGVTGSFFPEWQRLQMLEAFGDETLPAAQAEWRKHEFIMPRSFVLSSLYIFCKTKYESQIRLHASVPDFICRGTFDKLVTASFPNLARCKHHTGMCDKCMGYHRQLREDLGDQEVGALTEVSLCAYHSFCAHQ